MPPGETDVVIDAENTIEPDSRATPPLSTTTSTSTSTATPDADTDDGYDTESVSGDSTSLACATTFLKITDATTSTKRAGT